MFFYLSYIHTYIHMCICVCVYTHVVYKYREQSTLSHRSSCLRHRSHFTVQRSARLICALVGLVPTRAGLQRSVEYRGICLASVHVIVHTYAKTRGRVACVYTSAHTIRNEYSTYAHLSRPSMHACVNVCPVKKKKKIGKHICDLKIHFLSK